MWLVDFPITIIMVEDIYGAVTVVSFHFIMVSAKNILDTLMDRGTNESGRSPLQKFNKISFEVFVVVFFFLLRNYRCCKCYYAHSAAVSTPRPSEVLFFNLLPARLRISWKINDSLLRLYASMKNLMLYSMCCILFNMTYITLTFVADPLFNLRRTSGV